MAEFLCGSTVLMQLIMITFRYDWLLISLIVLYGNLYRARVDLVVHVVV